MKEEVFNYIMGVITGISVCALIINIIVWVII